MDCCENVIDIHSSTVFVPVMPAVFYELSIHVLYFRKANSKFVCFVVGGGGVTQVMYGRECL